MALLVQKGCCGSKASVVNCYATVFDVLSTKLHLPPERELAFRGRQRRLPLSIIHSASSVHVREFSSSSHWRGPESLYDVLGVKITASQKEIKEAYIKRGKELHPDFHHDNELSGHQSSREGTKADIHTKFVAVNKAYEVLGKPDSRRLYDMTFGQDDPDLSGTTGTSSSPYGEYREHTTFRERAEASGYRVSHDYRGDRKVKRYTVVACILVMIFGFLVHYTIVMLTYKKHVKELDKRSRDLNSQFEEKRERMRRLGSLENQKEAFLKSIEDDKRSRRRNGSGVPDE